MIDVKEAYRIAMDMQSTQAIFFRRRHQPRRPPLAKIRPPGSPAPAIGPGTGRSGSGHLNEVNEARASLGRSWDAVVTVGQALLDHYYPAHTFDGSSGDAGKNI